MKIKGVLIGKHITTITEADEAGDLRTYTNLKIATETLTPQQLAVIAMAQRKERLIEIEVED